MLTNHWTKIYIEKRPLTIKNSCANFYVYIAIGFLNEFVLKTIVIDSSSLLIVLNQNNPRCIVYRGGEQHFLRRVVLGGLSTESCLRLLHFHFSQANKLISCFPSSWGMSKFNTLQRTVLLLSSFFLRLTELHARLPSLWIGAKELCEIK